MDDARGFTLIELMIVVAIVAILAALAYPAYQDFMARSQATEGFSLAGDARTGIALHYASKAAFPAGNGAAGLSPPASIVGRYVESVTVGNGDGVISVRFGHQASAALLGETLVLSARSHGGSIDWTCTGLERRYLPSACR